MNAIEIEKQRAAELAQAEQAVAATRARYVEGTVPFEAIGEAEANAVRARHEMDAAQREAQKERARIAEERRMKAEADAARAREAAIAVETKRLDELAPIDMVTDEDERDVIAIAKLAARIALRLEERSHRSAAVQNERGTLSARIRTVREGRTIEPPPATHAHELARDGAIALGRSLDVVLHALTEAFPQARHLMVVRHIGNAPLVDPDTRKRLRDALGVEREPTRGELAQLEAAERKADEAAAKAAAAGNAAWSTGEATWHGTAQERAQLIDASKEAQRAANAAQDAVNAVRAEIDARRKQTPKL